MSKYVREIEKPYVQTTSSSDLTGALEAEILESEKLFVDDLHVETPAAEGQ